MIVVDASALADLLLGTHSLADRVAAQLRADGFPQTLDLADVEVVSVLRRKARRGELGTGRGGAARAPRAPRPPRRPRAPPPPPPRGAQRATLTALPLRRHGAAPRRDRIWELRDSLSAYDAAYVALAEALAVPLLTTDARLARAGGHRAEIVAAA